MYAKVR